MLHLNMTTLGPDLGVNIKKDSCKSLDMLNTMVFGVPFFL